MALLDLLLLVLAIATTRSVWRFIEGVKEGHSGAAARRRGDSAPSHGVQMARDPVCGTYVVPERAVALSEGSRRLFFCSSECRDRYRAKNIA